MQTCFIILQAMSTFLLLLYLDQMVNSIIKDVRYRLTFASMFLLVFALLSSTIAYATPFGKGVFGAQVPFGSANSISMNLGSNVAINLSPSGSTFVGTGAHTVTVTTTDAVGYTLYVHTTGSANMTSTGGATIAASTNSTAGALSNNTWGYNTTGSTTNFIGMTTQDSIVKDASGPYETGDPTTITYGAVVDNVQPAGSYSIAITYTAIAKNE